MRAPPPDRPRPVLRELAGDHEHQVPFLKRTVDLHADGEHFRYMAHLRVDFFQLRVRV
jgi:hypothetical protein